ncbi:MAG: helix-turn-helix domain-containing protein [Pseudomonadales bacterium]|nr:helix-turn-helix domain-containing protein [Pseudomonadales bacterium]
MKDINEWRDRFVDRLEELKGSEGLTQQKLAERLGVTQGTIGHWKAGRRHPDSLQMYYSLADELKMPREELLAGVSIHKSHNDDSPTINEHTPLTEWEEARNQDEEFELVIEDISMIREDSERGGPSFRPGDIAMFVPDTTPVYGNYYLYILEGKDKPVFGQHYQSPDGFKIHFLSNVYSDIEVNDSNPGSLIALLTQFRTTNFNI